MSNNLRSYLDVAKGGAGNKPPLPLLLEAVNIMLQIAEAMSYLHDSGVTHRDLKESNVFINDVEDQGGYLSWPSVQVKLTDFGESKLKLDDFKYTTLMVGLTQWRAPEVFENDANTEKYTKAADVYSFAMIFFEVLTGEKPFECIRRSDVLQSILAGIRPPLPHVKNCPVYLSGLIEKCWATNPAERPQFPNISQLLLSCKNMILIHPRPMVFSRSTNYGGTHRPVSGWGISRNRKFSFGVSTLDARDYIDGHMTASVNCQVFGCFGVFEDSSPLFRNFFESMLEHHKFFDNPKLALVETYQQIGKHHRSSALYSQLFAAKSTACICVLVGDRLLVASHGDYRAMICKDGEAIALSTDHILYGALIEDMGDDVIRYNDWVLRDGFGEDCATEPWILEQTFEEGVDFLILATAGLRNVISNQYAVSKVKFIRDAEVAARRLVEEACRRGNGNNVTCMIVRFHPDA